MNNARPSIVIGNFDGVHLGHRSLLEKAKMNNPRGELWVMTFWPHPLTVIFPKAAPKLLLPLPKRITTLQALGADRVEILEFTKEFAALTPKDFFDKYLLPLDPATIVVGQNFRFGRRATGDIQTLQELSKNRFTVLGIDLLDDEKTTISSSRIRQALEIGDITTANKQLGRPFAFFGTVVHGDHRGRLLGFPTANLLVSNDLACPADGVYSGWLTVSGKRYQAAISVGQNPTFTGVENRRIEAFALGQEGLDLYGLEAKVEFWEHIRGMEKFNSVAELVSVIQKDVAACRTSLAGQK